METLNDFEVKYRYLLAKGNFHVPTGVDDYITCYWKISPPPLRPLRPAGEGNLSADAIPGEKYEKGGKCERSFRKRKRKNERIKLRQKGEN